MKIAYNLVRESPHYRREAFDAGLRACGYKVIHHTTRDPKPEDILVIWNRYGEWDDMARRFDKAGSKVLVAENGYYSPRQKSFAISIGQHHHGGNLPSTSEKVLSAPKIGRHILICAQRGIGSPLMASPPEWAEKTAEFLRKITNRPIRIREHPGKDAPRIPLSDDLQDCHACVVWSSAAGIEALINGVQVFYDAPRWIAERSAIRLSCVKNGSCDINMLYDFEKAGILNAFSNQWTVEEVAAGWPFLQLIGAKNEEEKTKFTPNRVSK